MNAGERTFSTRQICELAGVKAPTLYHHFGSKQGIIDAVIDYGFTQYVSVDDSPDRSGDPVQDLRAGWDRHVQFGLDHPTFYAMLYGQIEPGVPCAITAPATDMLMRMLEEVARRRKLRVTPIDAAQQILAANVGVTLALITQPDDSRDPTLSDRVREAALAAVIVFRRRPSAAVTARSSRVVAAVALNAALDEYPSELSVGELALMRELLARLSRHQPVVG
ncbi:MAG: hypothetical protein JWM76_1411 [Pseudonocardiales bacterium]|nr:hypothetical protein [Pseudonocardiales bacterium]